MRHGKAQHARVYFHVTSSYSQRRTFNNFLTGFFKWVLYYVSQIEARYAEI